MNPSRQVPPPFQERFQAPFPPLIQTLSRPFFEALCQLLSQAPFRHFSLAPFQLFVQTPCRLLGQQVARFLSQETGQLVVRVVQLLVGSSWRHQQLQLAQVCYHNPGRTWRLVSKVCYSKYNWEELAAVWLANLTVFAVAFELLAVLKIVAGVGFGFAVYVFVAKEQLLNQQGGFHMQHKILHSVLKVADILDRGLRQALQLLVFGPW